VVTSTQPLAGTRVLDLCRFVAGSYLTMTLGGLGADVIKVEVPPDGDPYRGQGTVQVAGESSLFLSLNGGKRSLALDIRHPDAAEVLGRLIDSADFVVHNARPGSLDRYGLGWDAVHARNPACIYASVSGYGDVGPNAGRGGFDLVLQAETGVMSVTGGTDGTPVAIGAPLLDVGAGLSALVGILAAYVARLATGEGSVVGSSLLEFGLAGLTTVAAGSLAGGALPRPVGSHSPLFAPYGAFRAADDTWVVLAGAGSEHLWKAMCVELGLDALIGDPRFESNADRVAHRDELTRAMEVVLAAAPAVEWVKRLEAVGVPAGLITSVPASEQVAALDSIYELERGGETYRSVGLPFRIDGVRGHPATAAPRLGEHTEAVLRGLHFAPSDIATLAARGVITIDREAAAT
jgi:crotonobetainyl-CoA:carnitine CoA-transferase CaiB-like acyl-CoA transferase